MGHYISKETEKEACRPAPNIEFCSVVMHNNVH